jgi:hypothetical protein
MKTTIDLSDDLLRRAKVTAATRGVSLKRFFTEAVEDRLRRVAAAPAAPAWLALAGELAPLRAETRRIGRLIEEEFEQIDAEDEA